MRDLPVAAGLAVDASRHAGQSLAAAQRDRLAAFDAVCGAATLRQPRTRALHTIGDGVVNLIENGALVRPAGGH